MLLLNLWQENRYSSKITLLGVPDKFIEHGTPEDLYKECGIDTKGIINSVLNILKK